MNDIASRLNQLIDTLELSNAEFGRRIGVSRSSVSLWTNGINVPSETTIREICRQFNVDYNWLKFGKFEMFLKTPATFMKTVKEKFELTEAETALVVAFLESDKNTRTSIITFMNNFFKTLEQS